MLTANFIFIYLLFIQTSYFLVLSSLLVFIHINILIEWLLQQTRRLADHNDFCMKVTLQILNAYKDSYTHLYKPCYIILHKCFITFKCHRTSVNESWSNSCNSCCFSFHWLLQKHTSELIGFRQSRQSLKVKQVQRQCKQTISSPATDYQNNVISADH